MLCEKPDLRDSPDPEVAQRAQDLVLKHLGLVGVPDAQTDVRLSSLWVLWIGEYSALILRFGRSVSHPSGPLPEPARVWLVDAHDGSTTESVWEGAHHNEFSSVDFDAVQALARASEPRFRVKREARRAARRIVAAGQALEDACSHAHARSEAFHNALLVALSALSQPAIEALSATPSGRALLSQYLDARTHFSAIAGLSEYALGVSAAQTTGGDLPRMFRASSERTYSPMPPRSPTSTLWEPSARLRLYIPRAGDFKVQLIVRHSGVATLFRLYAQSIEACGGKLGFQTVEMEASPAGWEGSFSSIHPAQLVLVAWEDANNYISHAHLQVEDNNPPYISATKPKRRST